MSKDRKLLILVAIAALLVVGYIIIQYEQKINQTTNSNSNKPLIQGDFQKKVYTAKEIRTLIKALPTYQGDSIIINSQGKLISMNALVQSVVEQMYNVPANYEPIQQESENYGLPEPYVVYRTAINYYIQQYGDKNTKKTSVSAGDSTAQ